MGKDKVVWVLVRSGGASAREYEESFTVIGAYKNEEEGRQAFHSLVDEAITDGGFTDEGENDHGVWTYRRQENPEDELRHWEFLGQLHMIDDYQSQYMQLSRETLQ